MGSTRNISELYELLGSSKTWWEVSKADKNLRDLLEVPRTTEYSKNSLEVSTNFGTGDFCKAWVILGISEKMQYSANFIDVLNTSTW